MTTSINKRSQNSGGRLLRNEVIARRDTAFFDYTDWLYGDQD